MRRYLDPNPNPDSVGGAPGSGGTQPGMFEFVQDGVKHTITLDEARARVSKASAADERFRQAAEARKAAEQEAASAKTATAAMEAARRLREDPDNVDEADLRTVAEFMGLDGDFAVQTVKGATPPGTNAPPQGPREIGLESLPKELRDLVKAVRGGRDPLGEISSLTKVHNKSLLNQSKDTLRGALTKDPLFGILLEGPKGTPFYDKMWEEIEGRVNAGDRLTSAAEQVVEKYRDLYSAFDEAVSRKLPGLDVPGALGGAPGAASILSRLQPQAEPDYESIQAEAVKAKRPKDAVRNYLKALFGQGPQGDFVPE